MNAFGPYFHNKQIATEMQLGREKDETGERKL